MVQTALQKLPGRHPQSITGRKLKRLKLGKIRVSAVLFIELHYAMREPVRSC
jgi:hypothetical protein